MQAPVELEADREGQLTERVVQLVRDADPLAYADRLGHLGVQAGVLERHRGVIGRGPEHLDLFPLEHPPRPVADREDTDRGVVVEERDREHRPDRHRTGLEPAIGRRRRHCGVREEVGRRH